MAVVVALATIFIATTASAKECETPEKTIQLLNDIGIKHDLDYEVNRYEGDRAKSIREYIKTKAGENIPAFDTVIIAKSVDNPKAYVGVHLNGCLVLEMPIPAAEYFELKTIGDGV